MKILSLKSENVKRLVAVEIKPDGSLISIGGKNDAGKSSVLDSIAYALGGEKLVPAQPIRKGQNKAEITLDLGDYVITRKFWRDTTSIIAGDTEPVHTPQFGPTKSTLVVTNKDKTAKYGSPQALLDKLYGKLTFDPLAFSKEEPKRQNAILRQLTNLDFITLDHDRAAQYVARTQHKKTAAALQAKLDALPKYADAPAELISIYAIHSELEHANKLRQEADEEQRNLDQIKRDGLGMIVDLDAAKRRVLALKAQLLDAESEVIVCEEHIATQTIRQHNAQETTDRAKAEVPDVDVINTRLKEIESTNAKVRANTAWTDANATLQAKLLDAVEAEERIEAIDKQKRDAMAAAAFPVPGLGLTEDGVTFDRLPLEQVSSSLQLRVSVAIGLALNPTLKVLLIRNGNLLDEDALTLVAEQAEQAGAQIWMEYVTSKAGDVSVMLEDGHVQGA